MGTPFLDLRSVPAGIRTLDQGGDPLVANPADALQRPLNYPRIWLYAFSLLRINEQNLSIVGLLFAFLYLLCVSKLILAAKATWELVILLISSLSIAPLFALERGNTDLLVFALVFAGAILSRASERAGAFLIAVLLKLFPLAALAAEAIRQRGRNRFWPVGAIGLGIVLLAAQWRDLILIQRGTPVISSASFGFLSLKETLFLFFMGHAFFGQNAFVVALGAVVLCLLATLVLAARAWKKPHRFNQATLQTPAGDMFCVFASIYAATFVIGSNWDYRLIFLVPTAPFALELIRSRTHFRWGLAYILCLLFTESCVAFEGGYKSLVAQAVTLTMFCLVLELLVEQLKTQAKIEERSNLHLESKLTESETLALSR